MLYVFPILEVIFVIVPILIAVAFVTVAERKTMASMQRRLGPNIVGYFGLLQAFADALKLLLKEYIAPAQANFILFFIGPVITLIFALLGYAAVPFGPGLSIADFNLGILFMLAVSSLATYGILLAGWSANSKYAFLGSLRSTAQLISYELILTSAILIIIFITGSLNLTINIESQRAIWYIVPLLPVFLIFFIGSIAETNRAPFDLAEAESELVSGFMTEHAAVVFVFFFLAEYASIILICILTTILFLGGYLLDLSFIFYIVKSIFFIVDFLTDQLYYIVNILYDLIFSLFASVYGENSIISITSFFYPIFPDTITAKVFYYIKDIISQFDYDYFMSQIQDSIYLINDNHIFNLGFKSCIMIFVFIWVRASFPRIRYDQLMSFCWTILLPVVVAFIILVPCILYSFEILPCNIIIV